MATLADELQNDFADSGSERGDEVDIEAEDGPSGLAEKDLYGEENDDEDEAMEEDNNNDEPKITLLDEAEEEEEARLQSEKAGRRDHKDMRSVANFMRNMEPILEVSHIFNSQVLQGNREFTSLNHSPDTRYLPIGYHKVSVAPP